MALNMTNQRSDQSAALSVIALANCKFTDNETRTLFTTSLTLNNAFILSMVPPPVGTSFSLTLFIKGISLPPMNVQVVSTMLDPNDAGNSGFKVAFMDLNNNEIFEGLCSALTLLGLQFELPDEKQRCSEQRIYPRVWTSFNASIETPNINLCVKVANMSMSGALLTFDNVDLPSEIQEGKRISINITSDKIKEPVSLEAEVVRLIGQGDGRGAGIRFLEMDKSAMTQIEQLILGALGNFYNDFE